MSELGELTQTVLRAQQWVTRRVNIHQRQLKAVLAGQPARHRKLLRRLADELSIAMPSERTNKVRIRKSELVLRSRVLALLEKVGVSGWDLVEQQKIISASLKCERIEVHFAGLDIGNWYGRLIVKRRLYKEAYDHASALRTMWSEALALLAKIEAEQDDPAAAARDLLQLWTCLERQEELIELYSDAYKGVHKIILEEYKEQFQAQRIEIESYGTHIDTGVEALSRAMEWQG